jgi:hypothetical protein
LAPDRRWHVHPRRQDDSDRDPGAPGRAPPPAALLRQRGVQRVRVDRGAEPKIRDQERTLAERLISELSGTEFEPEKYEDEDRQRLRRRSSRRSRVRRSSAWRWRPDLRRRIWSRRSKRASDGRSWPRSPPPRQRRSPCRRNGRYGGVAPRSLAHSSTTPTRGPVLPTGSSVSTDLSGLELAPSRLPRLFARILACAESGAGRSEPGGRPSSGRGAHPGRRSDPSPAAARRLERRTERPLRPRSPSGARGRVGVGSGRPGRTERPGRRAPTAARMP